MSLFHRPWSTLRPPTFAIAAASLLWSAASFTLVWQWENLQAENAIVQAGTTRFLALQTGLDEYVGKLRALRALFSTNGVSRDEFKRFTDGLLEQDKGIQNLSWVPLVRHDRRAAFEASARAQGLTDFHIRDAVPGGGLSIAADRPQYLPIYFSTERDRGGRIYGIDLLSQAPIRDRLLRAADDNDQSTVPDFPLHSRNGTTSGILMSLPVYRPDAPIDSITERRDALAGFVHGAFVTVDAVDQIMTRATTAAGLEVFLYPAAAGHDAPPIYVHASRLSNEAAAPLTKHEIERVPHAFGILRAGEVQWPVAAIAASGGPLRTHHDRAWLVLACNLLVVGFAAWYERKLLNANRRIADLADHDPLTGLANRRAFQLQLSAQFEAHRRTGSGFALLYYDLDEFKDVNDTRGHPAGDRLLSEVARRLRVTAHPRDLVARLGGDEFAILHVGATDASIAGLAERSKCALAAPYDLGGSSIRMTASIGVAARPADVPDAETLMIQADLALYRAKHDGRNCYRMHTRELDEAVRQRVNIAAALVDAIENDELRLVYQPQVELASGRIVGVEALVRWQHPVMGLVNPNEFIGIAENIGVIDRLGAWVLDRACAQARAWIDAGLAPEVVAVNVSPKQFKTTPDLNEVVADALKKHRLQASTIELELTESVLMEISKSSGTILAQLRDIGLRISIDDFGTGYSSLNYLTRFPVSRLKIAQELVLGIVHDTRNAAVVRAAIGLAGELGIECMAEGVENARQLELLVEAGCVYGQGYHFSRPVPAERMTALLAQAPRKLPSTPRLAIAG